MTTELTNDDARTRALCATGILDTPPEERFDRITRIAAAAFSVPIALVSLIDSERQWFKSRIGLDVRETPRDVAFCSHAIADPNGLVVPDARLDSRFAGNPLVTGEPHIRFYAGHPIRTLDGFAVGTLCVIDLVAREFGPGQVSMLADLARMVEDEMNKDVHIAAREEAERALIEANARLEQKVRERTGALEEKNEALLREMRQRGAVELTVRQRDERIRSIIANSFSAFVSTDANGCILEWNASAERVFGWSAQEVTGKSIADVIVPQRMRAEHNAGMARYRSGGASKVMNRALDMPALTRSGAEIVVEMTISAFDIGGELFFGSFLQDISARLEAQRALEQKQELLDAVLETVDVAVIACNAEGDLTVFNRAAREFHGQSIGAGDTGGWAEQYDLYQMDGQTRLSAHDIPLVRALAGEQVKDVGMIIAPKGLRRRTVLASGRLLASAGGERLGAVVAMKDITELNEWQQRLRQNEQRLRAITENLPALIGQVDRDGRYVFLNGKALSFYGYTAERLMGQPVRRIYSDAEFAHLAPFIEQAMAGQRVVFESGFELKGQPRYFHASYVPCFDAAGRPDGFVAMAMDITARRQSELAQAESEEWLRTITDNVPALISYLDSSGRFKFANAMHEAWTGIGSGQMIGRTMAQVYGDDYVQARLAVLERCRQGHTGQLELPHTHAGHTRMLNATYIPHLRDGAVVGTYVLSSDTTAAHQDRSMLRDLANSDTLTGLPNRRCYEQALHGALQRSAWQRGLALMYLDIDHFKAINDTHGHAAGDQVLQEFCLRVKAVLRNSDMLARLAGDEFTVILDSVDSAHDAGRVADKILAALAPPFAIGSQQLAVSSSIGIALATCAACADDLSLAADQALYEAKRNGRGCYALLTLSRPAAAREAAPHCLERSA